MNVRKDSGGMGIIYFAWHGKAQERAEIKGLLKANWRRFAEKVLDESIAVGLDKVSRMWMRDDLFVCFALPQERKDIQEERLSRLATIFSWIGSPGSWTRHLAGESRSFACMRACRFSTAPSPRRRNGSTTASSGDRPRPIDRRGGTELETESARANIGGAPHQPVYQPILALQQDGDTLYGYEALSRFPGTLVRRAAGHVSFCRSGGIDLRA